ncbi:MAG: hypothetical protein U0559_09450 [Anaerolineae bacterium]
MSIRIGIYDFFAYTIPGALYLIAVGYLATIFGLAAIDFQWLANLAGLQALALAMCAYIGGLIVDLIAMRWSHLFRSRDLSGIKLDEFKKAHPNLDVKFKASDWHAVACVHPAVERGLGFRDRQTQRHQHHAAQCQFRPRVVGRV